MSLIIAPDLLEGIRDHGRKAYPHECCGLLLGKADHSGKSAVKLRPVTNAREDSPQNRYLISAGDWLAAERETRNEGLDIIGVYHSHPDHPPRPSEFDREHAFPWYSYIIVSVAGGVAEEVHSWILREDRSKFDLEEVISSDEGRN
jgi:proteasome lid subunit RPN8/RPN11